MDPVLASLGLLVFRLIFGISLIPHGLAKIKGYSQTKSWMKQIGLPGIITDLTILIEVIGGLLVIFGTLSFIVAIILILFFLGTTILSIYKFKKPIATGNVPGLDLDLLYLAGSILLLFSGPGEYAIFAGPQLSTFIQI
ncbi:MAG: DoxX family protein [Thermoproteota archaeon]|jgi:Predicted membrane protein